jgi:hypothetical protein
VAELKASYYAMRTIWVQLLIISVIILIPVSFALRVVYGKQWLEWEYGLVESWGISGLAYTLIKLAALVGCASYWMIRQRRRRQKDETKFYTLPSE